MATPKKPVHTRRKARLNEVLHTAWQLLAEDGLEAVTLQRISERLALSSTALYRYVSSKDELISLLQERSLIELAGIFDRARDSWARSAILAQLAPGPGSLLVVLATCRLYVQLQVDESPHLELMNALMGGREIQTRWARRGVPAWTALLSNIGELIDAAACASAIAPGHGIKRAALLWAALLGVTQAHKLRRLAPDIFMAQVMASSLGSGLLIGWGANRRDVETAADALSRMRMRIR